MDTVANMIIKIKNAGNVGHESVIIPFSKLKFAVSEVLKNEGYIKSIDTPTRKGLKVLELGLFVDNRVPKIKGVARVSKPSKRIYNKYSEIRPVKNGYGALILSTSQGVMTGRAAKKAKLGGEALFKIW